jgi:holo-[acyl-carrier protein] synthase
MIIGIGSDLVEIERIAQLLTKHGERFVERILTEAERARFAQKPEQTRAHWLAKRFAAKEAVAKALGTGFSQGISFQSMEISNDPLGKPEVSLLGKAKDLLDKRTNHWSVHLSLTDERRYAQAFAVIEGQQL